LFVAAALYFFTAAVLLLCRKFYCCCCKFCICDIIALDASSSATLATADDSRRDRFGAPFCPIFHHH